MKGLILAGGRGTRLRPLTHTQAKQLIPVANKPVLFYGLEHLAEAGIRDVGIVVGDTADEIAAAVGDGDRWGLSVTYVRQPAPLGLAHAVQTARAFLGEGRFVVYLGDNILRDGVRELTDGFPASGEQAQVLLARVPHPERFGVAEIAGDRVVRLVEKPDNPPSDLALVGVYLFDASIFGAIEKIRPSARGELEITDAIQELIDSGLSVTSREVRGWWKDTGKPADLIEANRVVLERLGRRIEGEIEDSSIDGEVVIETGARIVRSTVRGPAVVGPGATLTDAVVGPYSAIGPEVRIERAEIDDSIVMRGAVLYGLPRRVTGSLVGRDATIRGADPGSKADRVLVGDVCTIEVAG